MFKGGTEHAVLGNIVVAEPETLSKEDNEAFAKFMHSVKGPRNCGRSYLTA